MKISSREYTFNTHIAKHYFCSACGVKPFDIPRSTPDGIDVNVHCFDTQAKQINISNFDSQNWELHAHKLSHKSKEV